jgi:hypothetical protein
MDGQVVQDQVPASIAEGDAVEGDVRRAGRDRDAGTVLYPRFGGVEVPDPCDGGAVALQVVELRPDGPEMKKHG